MKHAATIVEKSGVERRSCTRGKFTEDVALDARVALTVSE